MGLELAGAEQRGGYGNLDDVNFTDSQLVYQVRNALTSAIEGDSIRYKQLIGVMHHNQHLSSDDVATLVTSLKTLSGAVSCIDIVHHRALLDAIFSMSLWKYNSYVLDALVELVISLAPSSAEFVDLCLDMLVNNFVPPLEFLKQPHGLTRKDQVLDRVHSTLKSIADLVPLFPLRLEKRVRERMPTKDVKDPRLLVIYVENMLRLESGTMGELVGSSMLLAVVDRLIELDVEIPRDDIMQVDSSKDIFFIELDDLENPENDFQHDGVELHREDWIESSYGGNAMAEKLDSLMVVTFEHLKFSSESGRLHLVFEILLQSFQKTVLTAHKAKFTQFVIFYACSLDPENCGQQFAITLLNIFVSGTVPQWRMSAAAYLASYLSRAKFVSASLVVDVLERLVNWCSAYCKNQDEDPEVFYAGCQAFMYVLCFRLRSIISIPRLRSQLVLMRIDEILKHQLNPLKVCLPSIVEEFLRVAKSSCVFPVPENFVPSGRKDMFFPFDPCLLKKSDRFIQPNYVYWWMVGNPYEQDVNNDDDEDSSDEDAIVGGGMNRMALNDDAARSFDEEDFDVDDDDNEDSSDEDAIVGGGMNRTALNDDAARSFDEEDFDDDDFDSNKMSITPKSTLGCQFGGGFPTSTQMPSRIRPSTSPESL